MTDKHRQDHQKKVEQKPKKRAFRDSKPKGFDENEKFAKELFAAKGESYFEWLDALHNQLLVEQFREKQKEIVSLFESNEEQ